ncbi:MAG: glutathione peroxidase [Prevotellaceae bacterium]|jgi:glutathione peroxidase|nr:glutathione peroxidase [Prevotellaceae bacterium]
MNQQFYDFKAVSLQGKEIGMDTYKGNVVLVVNTASKCGLTPQYEGLERLYRNYKDKGFVILGFPCNQFAGQEPGNEKQIAEGCLLNYGVSFQMFSKINVNGKDAHPLYKYLKTKLKGFPGNAVKWNFGKFLIDREGNPVKRFSPITSPRKLRKDIEKLL